jgi:hypothetical protein
MYSKSGRGCNGEEFDLEVERGPEVRPTELADDAFADGVEDQVGDAVEV